MAFNDKNAINTGTFIDAEKQWIDFSDVIALLDPDRHSLYSIAAVNGQKEKATQVRYDWLEDTNVPFKTTCAATIASGVTALVVADAGLAVPNSVLKDMNTGEIMTVSAVNLGTNTITIARGALGTTAAAITAGDIIVNIGNAHEEGSGAPVARTTIKTPLYNYTQIFKTVAEMTKTAKEVTTRPMSVNELDYQMKKRGVDHALDIERAFFLGKRYMDTTGTYPKTYTGGLESFITTNVQTDANGTLTRAEWDAWLNDMVFAHGSENKIIYVGGIIQNALDNWLEDKLQPTTFKINNLGVNLATYMSTRGKVQIKYQRFFDEVGYDGFAMAVDPSNVRIKVLRDTRVIPNIQENDADMIKNMYLSEVGLLAKQEQTHAILKGVTTFA